MATEDKLPSLVKTIQMTATSGRKRLAKRFKRLRIARPAAMIINALGGFTVITTSNVISAGHNFFYEIADLRAPSTVQTPVARVAVSGFHGQSFIWSVSPKESQDGSWSVLTKLTATIGVLSSLQAFYAATNAHRIHFQW
jgi:hypothetical protein